MSLQLFERFLTGVILHGRGARDHRQAGRLQTGQLRGHLFRKTVAEVSVFMIAAGISEWKHSELYFGFISLPSGRGTGLQTAIEPCRQLGPIGIDRAQLVMLMAIDGKTFFFFPSLDGPHIPAQEGGNLFPRVQAVGMVTASGLTGFGHERLSSYKSLFLSWETDGCARQQID